MRLVPFLPLLFFACSHSQPAKVVSRCSVVTSARDLARARLEDRNAYLEVKSAAEKIAGQFAVVKTRTLNDRNRIKELRPLDEIELMQARERIERLQHTLAVEADRLDQLAKAIPDDRPENLPDDIASNPRLTELQDACLDSQSKRETELATSRDAINGTMVELKKIVADYQLPLRLEER